MASQDTQDSQDPRPYCWTCYRPKSTCYCEKLEPFKTTRVKFCILMHSNEAKQRTGTGRMAHLLLQNSELFIGVDFTQNEKINAMLSDPHFAPMILFPGPKAIPLAEAATEAQGRMPLLFVLDGTWSTARRILTQSHNLRTLQCVSFESSRRSQFRFKKQPHEHCLSTIEAVDECVAILEPENLERRRLMQTFDTFVETQLYFMQGRFRN